MNESEINALLNQRRLLYDGIWHAPKGAKIAVLMKWRRTARMAQQLFDSWEEAKKAYQGIDDEERDMLEIKDCAERTEIRIFEELSHAIENETFVDEWNGPILPTEPIERMSPYNKTEKS